MNTFKNKYDQVEKAIFEEGLRIKDLHLHADLNIMIIVLNNGNILKNQISSFPRLSNASQDELNHFEIIASGTGIHWPELDEDLSLKGFLQKEIRKVVQPD